MRALNIDNEIAEQISYFVTVVKSHRAMSRTDINRVAQDVLVPVFKLVYNFNKLKNLDVEVASNFPAIDLADDVHRIAIQVTATTDTEKVKHTLDKFLADRSNVSPPLRERYDRLIVYILTEKQKRYSQSSIDSVVNGRYPFSAADDIWDFSNLLADTQRLPIEKKEELLRLLKKQIMFGGRKLRYGLLAIAGLTPLAFFRTHAPDEFGPGSESLDPLNQGVAVPSNDGSLLALQAERLAAQGGYDQALALMRYCKSDKSRFMVMEKVVRATLRRDEPEAANEVLNGVEDQRLHDGLCLAAAEESLELARPHQALGFACQSHDAEKSKEFLAEMSRRLLADNEVRQAEEAVREFERLRPELATQEAWVAVANAWLKSREPERAQTIATGLQPSRDRNRLLSRIALAMLELGRIDHAVDAINAVSTRELITDEHWSWNPILRKLARASIESGAPSTIHLNKLTERWIRSDLRYRMMHMYSGLDQWDSAIAILDEEYASEGSEARDHLPGWAVGQSVSQSRHGVSFRALMARMRAASSHQPDQMIATIRASRQPPVRDALLAALLPTIAQSRGIDFLKQQVGLIETRTLRVAAFAAASGLFGRSDKEALRREAMGLAIESSAGAKASPDEGVAALALCGSVEEIEDRLPTDYAGRLIVSTQSALVDGLGTAGRPAEGVLFVRGLHHWMLYGPRDRAFPGRIDPAILTASARDMALIQSLGEQGGVEHPARFLPLIYWDLVHPSMGGDPANLARHDPRNGIEGSTLRDPDGLRGWKSLGDAAKHIKSADQMQEFWLDFFGWRTLRISHPASLPPECGLRQRDGLMKRLAVSLAAETDPGWADAVLQITDWSVRRDALHECVGIFWTYVECGLAKQARRALRSIEAEIPVFRKEFGESFMKAELDRL